MSLQMLNGIDQQILIQSTTDQRSNSFLDDLHEWTINYNNPARISHNYRQLINDPVRIASDIRLYLL
jgi:hypothetical protein